MRRAIAAATILLATFLLSGGTAGAQDGFTVEVVGGEPLFPQGPAAPGDTAVGVVVLTNHRAEAGRLVVRVANVENDDNGCNEPESRTGDVTCGDDGGELGDASEITIREQGSDVELWRGSLDELAEGMSLDEPIGAGSRVELVIGWHFDVDSGNETQTDQLSFDVEFLLTQDLAPAGTQEATDVLGSNTTRPVRLSGAVLPATGAPGWLVGLAAFGVVAAGGGLVIARSARSVAAASDS